MTYLFSWVIFKNEFTHKWEYIQTTAPRSTIATQKERFLRNRFIDGQEYTLDSKYEKQKYITAPNFLIQQSRWSTLGGPLATTRTIGKDGSTLYYIWNFYDYDGKVMPHYEPWAV
jgi:hypothetical protein